jgi:acetamidase/formamidase
VIKGVYAEWPRLESDDSIMVAGSYRPLEDAFRIAHSQLIRWVVAESGLSVSDAYQLISQIATSRIANVVDPNYTIVAKVPKRYLPRDIGWMGGVHDRLRTIGRAVLSTQER